MAKPQPATPTPLVSFQLVAVCVTFAEQDVIEATVLNAFAQGCDRFLLIDHSSPDETVARALGAGAEHVADIEPLERMEDNRPSLVNDIMATVSAENPSTPTWWLHLDADEFPRGPGGRTIREYLTTLDRRYRVVGSTFLNHYPTGEPANRRRRHPIDDQPMCEPELVSFCGRGHYKHPLLRHDVGASSPRQWWGLHRPEPTPEAPWTEPMDELITHHFQFRNEEDTRRRLDLVGERRSQLRADPVIGRSQVVDALYAGRWQEVRLRRTRVGNRPVRLQDWRDVLPPENQPIARWYDDLSD